MGLNQLDEDLGPGLGDSIAGEVHLVAFGQPGQDTGQNLDSFIADSIVGQVNFQQLLCSSLTQSHQKRDSPAVAQIHLIDFERLSFSNHCLQQDTSRQLTRSHSHLLALVLVHLGHLFREQLIVVFPCCNVFFCFTPRLIPRYHHSSILLGIVQLAEGCALYRLPIVSNSLDGSFAFLHALPHQVLVLRFFVLIILVDQTIQQGACDEVVVIHRINSTLLIDCELALQRTAQRSFVDCLLTQIQPGLVDPHVVQQAQLGGELLTPDEPFVRPVHRPSHLALLCWRGGAGLEIQPGLVEGLVWLCGQRVRGLGAADHCQSWRR
mmetsp:Transcript_8140/g.17714  ORF Transcript_8140/g.17714 Transcript_8140/m.17714 type:complete len:322 (-) Transcript_8140:106-1071(-)